MKKVNILPYILILKLEQLHLITIEVCKILCCKGNSINPDQTASSGTGLSGMTLFINAGLSKYIW